MGNLSGVVGHLKKELNRAQQEVQRFTAALTALGSSSSNGHRVLSADARKRISMAQKKRWAKTRKGTHSAAATASAPVKRVISAAGRKRIGAATKARWAKFRAQKAKKAA